MKIVMGLGNPGPRYRDTRHNVGFHVLDLFAERHGTTCVAKGPMAQVAWSCEVSVARERVLLVKPRTYMNRSGRAARAAVEMAGAAPEEILVVHDDADLALGRVRIRPEGGAGGHNGIRSIMATLATGSFPRVKLGVRGAAREERDLADYVLDAFEPDEREAVEGMVFAAADAVEAILEQGLAEAMNRFNAPSAPAPGNS